MDSSSKGKEVLDRYAQLALKEEEDRGIVVEGLGQESRAFGEGVYIVGQFLHDHPVNFMAMQHTLASIWRPVKGLVVSKTSKNNRFLFQFFHERDAQRVLDDGPWTFNQNVLLIKSLKPDEQASSMEISHLHIWVQVYDLPIGFRVESILRSIGDFIGKFIQDDSRDDVSSSRNYLRIKVALDVQQPIKRRMKIKRSGGEWLWIQFKYERLPQFCFFCGILGHADKFCAKLFECSEVPQERPYDSSLRAQVGRSQPQIGAPWLRNYQYHGRNEGRQESDALMEVDPELVMTDGNPGIFGSGSNQGKYNNQRFHASKSSTFIMGVCQPASFPNIDSGVIADPKR